MSIIDAAQVLVSVSTGKADASNVVGAAPSSENLVVLFEKVLH